MKQLYARFISWLIKSETPGPADERRKALADLVIRIECTSPENCRGRE